MSRPIALQHSDALRSTGARLAEIKDAQAGLDKLEADMKQAIADVLKTHGLELKNLQMSLSLRSGKSLYPSSTEPDGWFSGSMSVK